MGLNNARYATNILSRLNGRGESRNIEATDIYTGGGKTYYFAKVKNTNIEIKNDVSSKHFLIKP